MYTWSMIRRSTHIATVRRLLGENRVVALLGPRQIGKTTLARQVARGWGSDSEYFDLESQSDLARLADPLLAPAEPLRGLVVLDEIQRRPEIFPTLRVLADRQRGARFLILGSASPGAPAPGPSETLAGRIAFHELDGLSLEEGLRARRARGICGYAAGFRGRSSRPHWPAAYGGAKTSSTPSWRVDLPQLGFRIPGTTLRRFWSMLAHVHGQILNWSELGRSMAVTDMTVRHYVDVLASTFMVLRVLPPLAREPLEASSQGAEGLPS